MTAGGVNITFALHCMVLPTAYTHTMHTFYQASFLELPRMGLVPNMHQHSPIQLYILGTFLT